MNNTKKGSGESAGSPTYKNFTLWIFLFFAYFYGLIPEEAHAAPWRSKSILHVAEPGLITASVPPELHFRAGPPSSSLCLDLELLGPDAKPRSFELYFRQPAQIPRKRLATFQVTLEDKRLIWESLAIQPFIADQIQIQVLGDQYLGEVDLEGRDDQGWHWLARKAAVFKAGPRPQAEIRFIEGAYIQYRLSFSGFTRKFEKTWMPLRQIEVQGHRAPQAYVRASCLLPFEVTRKNQTMEVNASLPGNTLWLEQITLTTQTQFQGNWELGREEIHQGVLTFRKIKSDTITHVNPKGSILSLPIHHAWPSSGLRLKLTPTTPFLDALKSLSVETRIPRITFYADQQGPYTLRSGTRKNVCLQNTPDAFTSPPPSESEFTQTEKNPDWRPEILLAHLGIKGGPFNDSGYTWKAPVTIPSPGFYRLLLNPDTALTAHPAGLRIVADNFQIPYFQGALVTRQISLSIQPRYESSRNTTQWIFELPQASSHWESIRFTASGLFERVLKLEIKNPAKTGWQLYHQLHWQNTANTDSTIAADLSRFPQNQREIRLTIDHGDNQPISLTRVSAAYTTRDLYFPCQSAGKLWLMGGNEKASAATYDLTLIANFLLEAEATPVHAAPPESIETSFLNTWIGKLLKHSDWSLYPVLGGVTLILLILIVRLFPKEGA